MDILVRTFILYFTLNAYQYCNQSVLYTLIIKVFIQLQYIFRFGIYTCFVYTKSNQENIFLYHEYKSNRIFGFHIFVIYYIVDSQIGLSDSITHSGHLAAASALPESDVLGEGPAALRARVQRKIAPDVHAHRRRPGRAWAQRSERRAAGAGHVSCDFSMHARHNRK